LKWLSANEQSAHTRHALCIYIYIHFANYRDFCPRHLLSQTGAEQYGTHVCAVPLTSLLVAAAVSTPVKLHRSDPAGRWKPYWFYHLYRKERAQKLF